MTGFKRGIAELAKGHLLSPILRAELMKPSFRSFTVTVEGWKDRPYDGWFHPSTHADWPARKLALYLTKPELIVEEEPSFEKVWAVTQGHFFHSFAGQLFLRHGIIEKLEIYGEDPVHRRRGHMDGRRNRRTGYELKSINQKYLLDKIQDAESLQRLKPGYYAQGQDYIDMHDLDEMLYLIIGVWYPYPMVEFVLPRDEVFIAAQRAKYIEAQEMAAAGLLPDSCCLPQSTEARSCEMRRACPIGRIAVRR
jgi:hypothetical protein